MADFRKSVIDQLGMKLRDGQTEFTDDQIIRKIESVRDAYGNLVKRETQLDIRFRALSDIAGEEATQKAVEATPSEEKMTLLRWFDPKGNNFLGSGLTAEEYSIKRNIGEFNRYIFSQLGDEQKRRMDLVIRLSVEYHRIRREDLHGTASLEGAIESIIKGEEAERFDESIGWMMEKRGTLALQGEEKAQYEEKLDRRTELWAPAVAICREFTDAWKPTPQDRPRYNTWEEMLEKEPGIVRVEADPEPEPQPDNGKEQPYDVWRQKTSVWMMEHEAHLWGTPERWNLILFHGDAAFWQKAFKAGVRWRGPRIPCESGYWHREDGEKFPDDKEKFWGNNYHRIYQVRDLRSWLYRHKESDG